MLLLLLLLLLLRLLSPLGDLLRHSVSKSFPT
jgi:hypothetical protein